MELPKHCHECRHECGSRELLPAMAVYDDEGSYWLCYKCFRFNLTTGDLVFEPCFPNPVDKLTKRPRA